MKEEICQLKEATTSLWRLQNIRTNMRQIKATTSTKKSRKLVKSLSGIQAYALRLYEAILLGWAPGCHSTHKAQLVLEDRIEPPISPTIREKLDFKLIFSSEYIATADILWYEGQVEVIETDHDTILPHSHVKVSSQSTPNIRATIACAAASGGETLQSSARDVKDICVTIAQAMQEKKSLKWYLMSPQRLRYCHATHVGQLPSSIHNSRTVSLATLLKVSETSTDISRSRKIPLVPRLSLALTLASTLIQLVMTLWLENVWSKDSIRFPVKIPAGASSNGQDLDPHDIEPSQVDLDHPLVIKEFNSTTYTLPVSIDRSEPRRMILELGIMLLELIQKGTSENYLATSGYIHNNKHSYQYRRIAAQLWLEESKVHLLPKWYKVTARCIQCSFDDVPANPQ